MLGRIAGGDPFTGLLSAMQTVRRRRHQPIGQDREGLVTRVADSASHPDAFVPVVVSLTGTPSMSNDRVVLADRTSPRQEVQGDHPGSMLSFASGSAIKRITAGVKARRWTVLCESSDLRWGLHPPTKSDSNEKKNTALRCRPRAPLRNIGRFISTSRPFIGTSGSFGSRRPIL